MCLSVLALINELVNIYANCLIGAYMRNVRFEAYIRPECPFWENYPLWEAKNVPSSAYTADI